MGLWKYIKAAFKNHWNLLAVASGSVFSFLAGVPEVGLPLIAAGELTYLGLLATHPRFQRAIDAQEAKVVREKTALSAEQALERIRGALPRESLERYEALRTHCKTLRQIATDLRQPNQVESDSTLDLAQLKGLDRLLWIFLRLLYTEHSLGRFLSHTRVEDIDADIERLTRKLAGYSGNEVSPRRVKARRAVEDTLETSKARRLNFVKAKENHELVRLELDRLEHKIRGLGEMSVNRQEPEFISSQVDTVAQSMVETERTMDELEFATGLGSVDEVVPELMPRPRQKTR